MKTFTLPPKWADVRFLPYLCVEGHYSEELVLPHRGVRLRSSQSSPRECQDCWRGTPHRACHRKRRRLTPTTTRQKGGITSEQIGRREVGHHSRGDRRLGIYPPTRRHHRRFRDSLGASLDCHRAPGATMSLEDSVRRDSQPLMRRVRMRYVDPTQRTCDRTAQAAAAISSIQALTTLIASSSVNVTSAWLAARG